jgi:hypothetical protein
MKHPLLLTKTERRDQEIRQIHAAAYFDAHLKAIKVGLSEDDAKWAGIDAAQEACKRAGLDNSTPKA